MTFSHALLNVILWGSLAAWFVKFLCQHSHHRAQRRSLGIPSAHCQRWSTADANILTRREG